MFTTVGPEQEYFLIDERFYFERPDLITTGRTLFGAKPPKGHELDDHYFGSIPERVLACMLETEQQLAMLGVPVKTRHNEVAPAQYEIAPVFENSNVGSDHQQLTMQVMQNVARRYGLVCLLHEKPFAGVNGSGKHNNWSMGTDTGHNLLEPGDTPHENLQFLFFCAAVLQAVDKHQQLLRGRSRCRTGPPAGSQRGAARHHLGLPRRRAGEGLQRDRVRLGRRGDAAELPRAGRLRAAGAADARRRPQPHLPVRLHGQQVRVPALGSSMSLALPNTVLNTIVAEAIDELADEIERLEGGGKTLEEAVLDVRAAYTAHKRIVFDGDNYADEWHAEAEQRGLANLRQTPDALPWLVEPSTVDVFSKYDVLSERDRVALRGAARAVRHDAQHRGRDGGLDRPHDAAAGRDPVVRGARRGGRQQGRPAAQGRARRPARRVRRGGVRARDGEPRPPGGRRDPGRGQVRPDHRAAGDERRPRGADRLERIIPDELWPLPKYSEILFIK